MTKQERETLAAVADTAARLAKQVRAESECASDRASKARLKTASLAIATLASVARSMAGAA